MQRRTLSIAGLLVATLCACSGGSSNLSGSPVPTTTATPAPSPTSSAKPASTPSASPGVTPSPNATMAPSPAPTVQAEDVAFVVTVPAPATLSPAARARRLDVSASAQSVTVALGSTILATGNVAPGSSSCAAAGATRACTLGANAPAGSDAFTLTAYDQPNGAGNVLATGSVSATVPPAGSTPARVDVVLSGTIATLALAIVNAFPPVGTATTTPVLVTAYDADGNTIIGSYTSPIALSDADTTGATKLSATSLGSSASSAALTYSGLVPYLSTTITASFGGVSSVSQAFAPTPAFLTSWQVPSPTNPRYRNVSVADMVLGPDGNMWAVANSLAEVFKVTPSGAMTEYPLSNPDAYLERITVGADGDLWFAENANNAIGKIAPSTGTITTYPLPLGAAMQAEPDCVIEGSDGRVWFWDENKGILGAITTGGTVTEYPGALPSTAYVAGITSGADGNIWAADGNVNAIDKVSTAGVLLGTYPIPTPNASVFYLAPGPDGNVWFTEFNTSKIGRVTPGGSMAEWVTPTGASGPYQIVPGPDGRMWYGEMGAEVGLGKIGYISLDGSQSRDFLGDGRHLRSLAFDPKKKLWYVGGWVDEEQEFGTFGY
jgi:streptogramin lyase